MKKVTFVVPTRIGTLYNAGEHASFEDLVADSLVAQGFAVAGIQKGYGPEEVPAVNALVPAHTIAPAEVSPRTVDVLAARVTTAGDTTPVLATAEAVPAAGVPVAPGVHTIVPEAPGLTTENAGQPAPAKEGEGDQPSFIPSRPGKPKP